MVMGVTEVLSVEDCPDPYGAAGVVRLASCFLGLCRDWTEVYPPPDCRPSPPSEVGWGSDGTGASLSVHGVLVGPSPFPLSVGERVRRRPLAHLGSGPSRLLGASPPDLGTPLRSSGVSFPPSPPLGHGVSDVTVPSFHPSRVSGFLCLEVCAFTSAEV